MTQRKSFGSDNQAGAHDAVLSALARANSGDAVGYGDDPWTQQAATAVRTAFGARGGVFFVLTGTAANVLGLSLLLRPYEGVICAESAHVNVDECGAPERILGAYAWRTLRESGAAMTFNSDNPGSDHNIFYGLHSAITRQDKNLQPEGGWYPEQRMSSDEAVRGYTNWSAYASFREDDTGIIEPGRWADLTVLDIDPFVLADETPSDILNGRVLMTIANGEIVYER